MTNKKNAVSLLEVLIAAFILGVAFIPILKVVDFGSVSTSKLGVYAKATRLAQQLIEEARHVPFRTYQKFYTGLVDGTSFPVAQDFYPETAKSIEEFFKENRDIMKDYGCDANLKSLTNKYGQISEVWFEVEIYWKDIGEKGDKSSPQQRTVRLASAYHNTEAL